MLAHEFVSDAFNEYSLVWDHKLQLCIQDKLRKRRRAGTALEITLLSWDSLPMFEGVVTAYSR